MTAHRCRRGAPAAGRARGPRTPERAQLAPDVARTLIATRHWKRTSAAGRARRRARGTRGRPRAARPPWAGRAARQPRSPSSARKSWSGSSARRPMAAAPATARRRAGGSGPSSCTSRPTSDMPNASQNARARGRPRRPPRARTPRRAPRAGRSRRPGGGRRSATSARRASRGPAMGSPTCASSQSSTAADPVGPHDEVAVAEITVDDGIAPPAGGARSSQRSPSSIAGSGGRTSQMSRSDSPAAS